MKLAPVPESFIPTIAPEVFALRPDYCALSIVARGVDNARPASPSSVAGEQPSVIDAIAWIDAHLESWRAAYRSFGAKPQRTPCSAEALRNRLAGGARLPSVNAVVDRYNALSVRYGLPIGGENLNAYAGLPRLVRARGDERFDTLKECQPATETVPAGEVVWLDDLGVTCRRWNWRQGVRTRIEASTTDMWFVVERLEPMPLSALNEVGEQLTRALQQLSPTCQVSVVLLNRTGSHS
ncbi:MAG TPA: phenylalanine--tRNA ligase beta subunit-related protein [Steroidobacteraceae bacterium]